MVQSNNEWNKSCDKVSWCCDYLGFLICVVDFCLEFSLSVLLWLRQWFCLLNYRVFCIIIVIIIIIIYIIVNNISSSISIGIIIFYCYFYYHYTGPHTPVSVESFSNLFFLDSRSFIHSFIQIQHS